MSTTATIPNATDTSSTPQGTPTPTGIPYVDAPPQSTPAPQQQQPAADTKPDTSSWDHAAQNPGDVTDLKAPAPDPVHTLTTSKPGGIIGVMQSVMDSLVGKTTPEIATDNDGNKYIHQVDATGQQQWKRLAGEALAGAAAGFAAGQGAGHMGHAAAAGIQAQQQQQQQRQQEWDKMSAEARQENMDRANRVMQNMQIAKTSWELSNAQHKAGEDTIKFSNDEVDRYQKMGGQVLGVAKDYSDIAHILKQDPDAVHNMIVKGDIVTVPAFDDKGNRAGTTFVKLPNGWAKQMLPSGTEFKAWNGQTHQLETRRASDGMTTGEQELLNNSAVLQQQQWQQQQHDQQQKDQAAKDKSSLNVSEITKNVAMANKDNAEASRARAAASAAAGGSGAGTGDDSLVSGMLNNTVDIRKLSSLRADHREKLVREAQRRDPNWDEKKYENAMDLRDDFLHGKASQNIQSAQRFLGHADQLTKVINRLRNTNSPILNTPINKIKANMLGDTGLAEVMPFIEAASNEHMNFLLNGKAPNVSDKETRDASLNTSMTPAQVQQRLKSDMAVQLTQLGAMNNRYKNGVGKDYDAFFDPNSRAIINEHGLGNVAARELGGAWQSGPSNPNAPPAPPAVGTVKDGYRFKGGNPADHANWEPIPPSVPAGR